MELLGVGVVIVAVLAFGLIYARFGLVTVTKGKFHGRPVRSLPSWYIGGQPDVQSPPPNEHDDGEAGEPQGPAPEARELTTPQSAGQRER